HTWSAARARARAGRDARQPGGGVGTDRLEQAERRARQELRRQRAAADVAVGDVVSVEAQRARAELLARAVGEREPEPPRVAGGEAADHDRRVLDGDVDPVDAVLDDVAAALRVDLEPARERLGETRVRHRLAVVPEAPLAVDADGALAGEARRQRRV